MEHESHEAFAALVAAVLFLVLYFAPTVVAVMRKHNNAAPIFLTNLFTGATVIGWLIAFIWAFSDNVKRRRNYDDL